MTSQPQLGPPTPLEPMDTPATQPPLDLSHMIDQVNGIQTFLSAERERDEARKRAWDRANKMLRGETKEAESAALGENKCPVK